jgi:hypothetical protein
LFSLLPSLFVVKFVNPLRQGSKLHCRPVFKEAPAKLKRHLERGMSCSDDRCKASRPARPVLGAFDCDQQTINLATYMGSMHLMSTQTPLQSTAVRVPRIIHPTTDWS